jgi:hypothetical protein
VLYVAAVLFGLASFGILVWLLARSSSSQQEEMYDEADDLRRADDETPPFTDYGSPMG